MRHAFFIVSFFVVVATSLIGVFYPVVLWTFCLSTPLILIGVWDAIQVRQAIRRNFPLIGNFRYMFEAIRPEISQYFIERDTDGRPVDREQRSVVYQRAKRALDTLPFGTKRDVYHPGYTFVQHSLCPKVVDESDTRVLIGGAACKQPYLASRLNISAMSFGALSKNAVLALNGAAKDGNFAHNTGEGGVSPYHLQNGGDLILQVGTGYFGFRDAEGNFEPEKFKILSANSSVKMIEIKLSQGAKPAHGGVLPAEKVTPEIAAIRHIEIGKDVISPPTHSAFNSPIGLLEFVAQLRDLSGGKPVGFKLCIGRIEEWLGICKAMTETGTLPDFIVVDGGEGGTGAAPLEFTNHIGMPGQDALMLVDSTLRAFGLRSQLKLIATGKVTAGFHVVQLLAMGADAVYSARGMMFALGCIQALQCHSNRCPTGVATQDPMLVKGLHVPSKRERVRSFHSETIHATREIVGAMGLSRFDELQRRHLMRRTDTGAITSVESLEPTLAERSFLEGEIPQAWKQSLEAAAAGHW